MTVPAPPTHRVVVVTGASSGIGRATALEFARGGADLVLAARGQPGLLATEAECRALGARTMVVVADVTDEDDVGRVAAAAVSRFGRVDVWVHTAAVIAYGSFLDVPSHVFRQVIDVDVHGTVHVARSALRLFRQQGSGVLVLMGSLLGEIASPFMGSYVTSKWAVRGLGRVLAIETRDASDIHVCVVSPGPVNTPIYRQAANYAGRVGRPPPPVDRPEKVARAIVRCADRPRNRVSTNQLNKVMRLGFVAAPPLFDQLVTPLMRAGGLSRQRTFNHEGNVFAPKPVGSAVHGSWGRHWLRALPAVLAGAVSVAATRRRLHHTSPSRQSQTSFPRRSNAAVGSKT